MWKQDRIVVLLSKYFNVDPEDLDIRKKGRKGALSEARSAVAYYMFNTHNLSTVEIAKFFKVNHSSVHNKVKTFEDLSFYNKKFKRLKLFIDKLDTKSQDDIVQLLLSLETPENSIQITRTINTLTNK